MADTDRDPINWVTTSRTVRAFYAHDHGTHAVGRVIAYSERPTVLIEQPDGTRVTWMAHLCEPASAPLDSLAALDEASDKDRELLLPADRLPPEAQDGGSLLGIPFEASDKVTTPSLVYPVRFHPAVDLSSLGAGTTDRRTNAQ